ncbi:hypothetical protein H112_01725 [Trichophyton rubrum D6]|uniref:GPI anchored protein n=4 Tax=Trichophyton TaxID=5550 RepID=A0A178F785_TRIRU|nr:hypothetical protein H100_01721 [Trichophyton rubrum MR850]EZF45105.1 hypothetical protein H102_01713 [Trichophyton rubrum CBS 100081]EZF55764.1 hypothetical protein H103_01727 [Trichophyton rubrum CBS 288.86]EZF66371.1 hypothetical protein H104_01702 [Trichophyton rubrum CBS 289.86]EZF77004.1 hypothetical protein H105_01729 [Trichophyton soudanense CBS 452.61]EZF87665.1 hypothetical protein H110_01725 [Trichophyton rubrum MR1448]EZG20016.1 hypothetical protein H107_01780 [Trichophyton rub
MQFKTLSILLLSASAVVAAPQEEKRDIIDQATSGIGGIGSDIGDIATDIGNIGKSLTALFPSATAIPASVWSSLTDASHIKSFGSSLHSAISDHHAPAWFSNLPASAQSAVSSAAAGITSEIGDHFPSATGTPGATPTTGGGSHQTNTPNAAPRATALAASIAGAAGLLGLAVAL